MCVTEVSDVRVSCARQRADGVAQHAAGGAEPVSGAVVLRRRVGPGRHQLAEDRAWGAGSCRVSGTLLGGSYPSLSPGGGTAGSLADTGLLRLCVRQDQCCLQ